MAKSKPKKSLGQNFLRDQDVVAQIVTAAEISEGDVVIEVGPGEGVLTAALVDAGARVFAMEIDAALIPALEKRFGDDTHCTIVHADIRRFNVPAFLAEQGVSSYKVVANLPYYITSSIIRLFLESEMQPSAMVLMVQKEVAARICAAPGAMSTLSVAVQFYGTPAQICTVPATAFEPVPQVDSAVIRVTHITRPLEHEEEKEFFRTVRAGFSARRKKLVNNLANSFHHDKQEITAMLASLEITPTARAQELTVAQWHILATKLAELV